MPSIRESWEHRERLLQEANQVWRQLASELVELIPSSMQKYANEMGWYPSTIGDTEYWKLPEFLEYLVTNTLLGSGNSDKIRETELHVYGFTSFDKLEEALRELEQAWKGLVRIEIRKDEGYRWEVYFYAAEIVPKPPKS